MLSFRPDLVRGDGGDRFRLRERRARKRFHLAANRPADRLRLDDAGSFRRPARWAMPPPRAPKKGEASADYGVTAFIELLQDIEAFDLAGSAPHRRTARA